MELHLGKADLVFFFFLNHWWAPEWDLELVPLDSQLAVLGGPFLYRFCIAIYPPANEGGGESDEKITGMGFSSDIRSFSSVIQKPFQDFSGAAASL